MALEPITRQEKIIAGQDLEPITRMEMFLKQYGGGGGGGGSVPAAGGVTTLHINVTAVNFETMEATFTADKTQLEIQEASVTGPIWCVVTIAAGIMAEEAVSVGVPPAWYGAGVVAFGGATENAENDNGNNKTGYAVRAGSAGWLVDLTQFGG